MEHNTPVCQKHSPMTAREAIVRWPCLTAHLIAESLGYATPTMAALIILDARSRQPNFCEWISACYRTDAAKAVADAIRSRHYHKGYMAEYKLAKALVDRAIKDGSEPIFASWF